jgi:hypothetical protein
MWMGGTVPLGYEVRDRKLVVNEAEAATVRRIYADYLALGSVRLLEERLRAEGVVGKSGRPLGRGALFHMLANRVYRGEVVHKGAVYPGEHAAIVNEELWEGVQGHLAEGRAATRRDGGRRRGAHSPLAGILFDASGERLTPTHAIKNGKRYRYYASPPPRDRNPRERARGDPLPGGRARGARHRSPAPPSARPCRPVRGVAGYRRAAHGSGRAGAGTPGRS